MAAGSVDYIPLTMWLMGSLSPLADDSDHGKRDRAREEEEEGVGGIIGCRSQHKRGTRRPEVRYNLGYNGESRVGGNVTLGAPAATPSAHFQGRG